jgi:hypothetical protein
MSDLLLCGCGHDWHGGALCAAPVRVTLSVEPILGFDKRGAGPVDAWCRASRFDPNAIEKEFNGACACRGAA